MFVSDLVRSEVARRYDGRMASEVLALLESAKLVEAELPTHRRLRDRIQLAIIKLGGNDAQRLRSATDLAATDWRDLLMAAELANEDWPDVLQRAGFPVP